MLTDIHRFKDIIELASEFSDLNNEKVLTQHMTARNYGISSNDSGTFADRIIGVKMYINKFEQSPFI